MFSESKEIKNRKAKEIILILLSFIIVPIASVLIINAGEQSALYNSLSRLAWPEGLLWLVYIWGALNFGNFAFATKMTLDQAGYTKKWQWVFWGIIIASVLLMIVGISIPSYLDPDPKLVLMRSVHTALSSVGFFGFFFVLIIMAITTYFRNENQFYLSAGLVCFTLIIGVFFLVKVSDPDSYCHVSAPSQVLLFGLYNLNMTLNYYFMKIFPRDKIKK
ncbi:MAG: hypothetical protein IJ033_00040 [Clostridia bacterium]|nr:hypothetical protein [Clostridia bacterium]